MFDVESGPLGYDVVLHGAHEGFRLALFLFCEHVRSALRTLAEFHQLSFHDDEHDDAFAVAVLHVQVHGVVVIALEQEDEAEVFIQLGH